MNLNATYTDFVQQAMLWAKQNHVSLTTWADTDSVSPAQQGQVINNQVHWLPVLQAHPADFTNVENALDISLDADIKAFYGQYYGAGMAAQHARGKLMLLMVWDDNDLKRLQENIIAHILMKRRLKQRETIFFATTEDDDYMLSVLNSTGAVYLERVGQEVQEKLADNLAEFLTQLTPCGYDGL